MRERGGDRWLLPEGVDDVLPPAAAQSEALRRRLLDLFAAWGYELVIPAFIEYLDSLLTGIGRDLDLQTFKLIDQLTGKLIGVRADMTPQVARIEAHHLKREGPVRLCYLGTVLHTLPYGLSRSRSPVQVGAELYGHDGIESDCEILCLMLETLETARVWPVHVDLGHVGVFRGLARQAGLGAEVEAELHDALQRKAKSEIVERLNAMPDASPAVAMIPSLADLNGDDEVLARARTALAAADREVHDEIDRLEQLASEVRARVSQVEIHFDLAELRGYRYHTGVVFAAFVPGHGQEVARGGRYDEIGDVFGRARPATGFSTDLKTLVALSSASGSAPVRSAVAAPWSSDPTLLGKVRELRRQGECVVYELPGAGDATTRSCDRRLAEVDGTWTVKPIE